MLGGEDMLVQVSLDKFKLGYVKNCDVILRQFQNLALPNMADFVLSIWCSDLDPQMINEKQKKAQITYKVGFVSKFLNGILIKNAKFKKHRRFTTVCNIWV